MLLSVENTDKLSELAFKFLAKRLILASSTSFSIFCFSISKDHCKRSNFLLAFSSVCSNKLFGNSVVLLRSFKERYETLEFSLGAWISGFWETSKELCKFSGTDATILLEVSEDGREFKLMSSSSGKFSIKKELIDFLTCITRNSCSVQISSVLLTLVSSYTILLTVTYSSYMTHCNIYYHFQNILRLFDVLAHFQFTTSETMGDYYL